MKNLKKILLSLLMVGFLTACEEPQPAKSDSRTKQSEAAAKAADSVHFDSNAEIDNIKKRLELTSKPNLLGYVLLFNPGSGSPALYTTVKGKITSGGKRLRSPEQWVRCDKGEYSGDCTQIAPNDEGTYGNSGEYIYFWDEDGRYYQWNGNYMYSNQPFRISKSSLLIDMVDDNNHNKK